MALARPQAFEILIAESADGRTFALNGVRLAGGIPELAAGGDGAVRLFFNDRGGIASYLSEDEGRTWRRDRGLRLAAIVSSRTPRSSLARTAPGRFYSRPLIPTAARTRAGAGGGAEGG